jgi:hypothetical protein
MLQFADGCRIEAGGLGIDDNGVKGNERGRIADGCH